MSLVLDNLDSYLGGMGTTVSLTLLSFAVAFLLGVIIAAFRVSPVGPLRAIGSVYVEMLRNTPLLVLFYLFFFGFPKAGIRYAPFSSAVIVLAAYTSAFIAETVRSGINTVPGGQAEAARSLGLTFPQVLGVVVLPQALRSVVGPLGSLFIALTKNSALASVFAVQDITQVADSLSNLTGRPLAAYLGAGVAYLLLTLPSGFMIGALERRLAFKR